MHIPDGFLDGKTTVATGALAVGGLALALRQAQKNLPARQVPLMGLSAAFVFAGQMLNFPVAGGTSGHLIGGALAAVLLGPAAAVVVLAAVLIVQCFMFADGGMLALGANVFNLGVVHPIVGYAIYRAIHRAFPTATGRVFAAGFAAWCATVICALICAGELAASGRAAWSVAFTAMTWVHMFIGVGEGAITAMTVAAVAATRPDLLGIVAKEPRGFEGGVIPADANWALRTPRRDWPFVGFGMLVAVALALFVAPFASSFPDGLEKVAQVLGFEETAKEHAMPAPAPDYEMPGFESAAVATAVAGGVGTAVMFALSYVFAKLITRRRDETVVDDVVGGAGPA